MKMQFTTLLAATTLAATLGVGCGGAAPSDEDRATELDAPLKNNAARRYEWWREERAARQADFDGFLATNAAAFSSFKNAALGRLGVPMVMMRLFPEIFPDIWGAPGDYFAPVGFAKDPFEPARVLPLGLGYAPSSPAVPTPYGPVNVNVATLTCMGCHAGRVQGNDGVLRTIVGAPNTQFDGFRGAIYRTVNDPRYTADAFRAQIAAKAATPGWLYGDPKLAQQEALELGIFMTPGVAEQFLAKLRAGSIFGAQRFAQTLGAYTYAPTPNAPDLNGHTPGYLDAIGAGIAIVVDPAKLSAADVKAALPPLPAMVDIMSVWGQSDRPAAQWDGSIQDHAHRNLAAEFGVVGDPTALNMNNVDLTTPFTDAMPAPPYPFDIENQAQKRGEKLYNRYCASCHQAGNASIFPLLSTGTDPNRAIIWKPYSVAALRQVLRAACSNPATCNHADGTPLADAEIVNPTGGYMALPLDGIWARAPYLHNGSVPTLDALLTKKRPTRFYRGNITYDEKEVGFTWNKATRPTAALYDTTKSGNSNLGHSSRKFLGDIDWSCEDDKRHDLLEYLKTL